MLYAWPLGATTARCVQYKILKSDFKGGRKETRNIYKRFSTPSAWITKYNREIRAGIFTQRKRDVLLFYICVCSQGSARSIGVVSAHGSVAATLPLGWNTKRPSFPHSLRLDNIITRKAPFAVVDIFFFRSLHRFFLNDHRKRYETRKEKRNQMTCLVTRAWDRG